MCLRLSHLRRNNSLKANVSSFFFFVLFFLSFFLHFLLFFCVHVSSIWREKLERCFCFCFSCYFIFILFVIFLFDFGLFGRMNVYAVRIRVSFWVHVLNVSKRNKNKEEDKITENILCSEYWIVKRASKIQRK